MSCGSWVSFSNQLDTKAAKGLMGQCKDAGVNFFANAEVEKHAAVMSLDMRAGLGACRCAHPDRRFHSIQAYAEGLSEVVMGEAIKELEWKRSDVVLSTKIY